MGFIKTRVVSAVKGSIGWLVDSVGALNSEYTQRQYFAHVGFISKVPSDAELITMKNGDNIVSIASAETDGDVPVLSAERDVAIHAGGNDYVMIEAGGNIKIITNGTVNIEGDGSAGSVVLGSGVADNLMKDSIISKFNGHVHTYSPGTLGAIATLPPSTSTPPTTYLPSDATLETKGS